MHANVKQISDFDRGIVHASLFTNQTRVSLSTRNKMELFKVFIQLVVVVLVSLSFIEACEFDSDCVSLGWEPAQCCNGECIDKYAKCPFWTVEMTIGLVFVCAVAFASSIVCFFCCRCCPGYSYRSHGTGTIIISGQPPYQQFTDHATAPNMAASSSAAVGVFYPQPPALQQYPMRHPMEVEDDLEETAVSSMGQKHPAMPYSGFAQDSGQLL